MVTTREPARSQGGGAQGARSTEGGGVPGKRTLTEGLPPASGQGVSVKGSIPYKVKEIKIPKKSMGYFEVSAEAKFTVSATIEETKPEAKPEGNGEGNGEGKDAHAESEVTIKPDSIEAEVKKKYADLGGGVSLEGSIGDSVNWKERKFELGAGLKLVSDGDVITSDVGVKFVPFTIDEGGIHIGELAIEGSGGLKNNASIQIGGAKITCKPSVSWKAAIELNKEKIEEELLKKIAERFGQTAAVDALIPASMIAAGALTVFMYFDSILAADDLRQLVDAGPPAVARARQFIQQATRDLQSGNGPALQQLSATLGKDLGGAIPPGLLARALRENVAPDQLKTLLWPPMRQQIISRSVAQYRSKHQVESTFKDMTSWVGEKLGAKDDHRSQYGEDILYRTLNEILPAAL